MKSRYLTFEGVLMLAVLGFLAHTFAQVESDHEWWQELTVYVMLFVVPVLSGVFYGLSIRKTTSEQAD